MDATGPLKTESLTGGGDLLTLTERLTPAETISA